MAVNIIYLAFAPCLLPSEKVSISMGVGGYLLLRGSSFFTVGVGVESVESAFHGFAEVRTQFQERLLFIALARPLEQER